MTKHQHTDVISRTRTIYSPLWIVELTTIGGRTIRVDGKFSTEEEAITIALERLLLPIVASVKVLLTGFSGRSRDWAVCTSVKEFRK